MNSRKKPQLSGLIIVILFLSMMVAWSCKHEQEEIADLREICFGDEILPIFKNSCGISSCHDEISAEEGYVFTNYASIIQAVNPGDPGASAAYNSLIRVDDDRMPPDTPLSLQSRQLIRIWISQGALNTTCSDTTNNPDQEYINPRACFQRDILPVLSSSCGISGCHDALSSDNEYVFTDYDHVLQAILPGNPSGSELYEKITEDNPAERMPPLGYDPLPQEYIDSIYNWILYGAPDEECGLSCDTSVVISFSAHVWPLIELNCRGCHSGNTPSGNVLLTDYTTVSNIASTGKLSDVLRASGGKPQMPPSGQLPECRILQVEMWIKNGYPDNK